MRYGKIWHLAMTALLVGTVAGNARAQSSWPSAGLDLKNSRYQTGEKKITPEDRRRVTAEVEPRHDG
jgi:hypothetical protein